MSIKFICSCGKHLRARDEMAARRSRCPRCGEPVGIPSLRPTLAGTMAAPLTPQERRRLRRTSSNETFAANGAVITALPPAPPFGGASAVASGDLTPRRVRLPRQMETHWYQCLVYPFLCSRVLAALTAVLTLMSGCLVLAVPRLPYFVEMTPRAWLPYTVGLLPPLLLLAYVCGTVECALTSALAGSGPGAYWPGRQLGAAFQSVFRWLVCFLAGPLVPAVLAGYYWLYGGDLTGLDWLILGELAVLAGAYWLLAVVRSAESGRLRDANPVRIGQLVHRLGVRALVPVFVAPVLAFAHILQAFFALGELHRHALGGLLLLALSWGSGLFWATFLFRLLGVWCYRTGERPA